MKVFRPIQICRPEVDFRHLRPHADATEFIGMLSAFMGLLDPGMKLLCSSHFSTSMYIVLLLLLRLLYRDASPNICYKNTLLKLKTRKY
jgi:hypothetical protein